MITKSVPEAEKTKISPSASVAFIVVTTSSFSAVLKLAGESIVGALSFKLLILTVIGAVLDRLPAWSVAVITKV